MHHAMPPCMIGGIIWWLSASNLLKMCTLTQCQKLVRKFRSTLTASSIHQEQYFALTTRTRWPSTFQLILRRRNVGYESQPCLALSQRTDTQIGPTQGFIMFYLKRAWTRTRLTSCPFRWACACRKPTEISLVWIGWTDYSRVHWRLLQRYGNNSERVFLIKVNQIGLVLLGHGKLQTSVLLHLYVKTFGTLNKEF